MLASSRPILVTLGVLLLGCGGPPREADYGDVESAEAAPDTGPEMLGLAVADPADLTVPDPASRQAAPPVVFSDLRDDTPADATPIERECLASRASGSQESPGDATFAMDSPDSRFRPRSAALLRHVTCGFRGAKLTRASETFSLRLASQDRDNPGFSIADASKSSTYYLLCEGSLRTSLAAFTVGQKLSSTDNTFTLPCGYMIYPIGKSDPAEASGVTGAYDYRVRSARLEVRRGPTTDDPGFELMMDVVVQNPFETLELRGRLSGALSTAFAMVECGTDSRDTQQAQHPACG